MTKNGGILITRAADQVQNLKTNIEAAGAQARVFPVLEIRYTPFTELRTWLADIQPDDWLIFVSMNAVLGVFNDIDSGLRSRLDKARMVAVGARTRRTLLEAGQTVAIESPADQQNSEGLLQHPGLQQMQGQRVFIVRAQSGRDTLCEGLQQRGARVQYIQAYTRGIPKRYDAQPIRAALANKAIDRVMLTSHDAFLNLLTMLGDGATALLHETCLIVPSQRVADEICADHAFDVCVAKNASDSAMLKQAIEQS